MQWSGRDVTSERFRLPIINNSAVQCLLSSILVKNTTVLNTYSLSAADLWPMTLSLNLTVRLHLLTNKEHAETDISLWDVRQQ